MLSLPDTPPGTGAEVASEIAEIERRLNEENLDPDIQTGLFDRRQQLLWWQFEQEMMERLARIAGDRLRFGLRRSATGQEVHILGSS